MDIETITKQGYIFEKDYKHQDALRHAFNKLADDTFGLDFEPWYRQGFWNHRYVCCSYRYGDAIVANVSFSHMDLILEGQEVRALQIGTVMTHPGHRRKGLAKSLLEGILKDHAGDADLFFLAADTDAKPLYASLGFLPWTETRFTVDLSGYPLRENPLTPTPCPLPVLLEHKRTALPLSSRLGVRNDEHVLLFYASLGYDAFVHTVEPDVTVLFEVVGDTLHLYDILSPRPVPLEALIPRIAHAGLTRVRVHFTPDGAVPGLHTAPDDQGGWMVMSPSGLTFPDQACFPLLAQT